MNVGLDFYGTIEKYPKAFKGLTDNYGGAVYIITAVKSGNEKEVMRLIKRTKIKAEVHIVTYENFWEVPKLKLRKCQELKIKLFFDDLQATVDLLNKHHITAIKV